MDAAAIPALLTGTAPPADGLTGITGAALGMERPIRWFSRLPLVDREDFEKAAAWFARYGRPAVVFSRLVPGVRSLIFLPAGADRMGLLPFSILTNAGSGIWNGLLIGLGALLGTRYELINQYSQYLDYAIYLSVAAVVAGLVIRRLRRRKRVA
ncbi:MAG: DedA family protein [Microbacteriaceae bacterium]